jgi:3-oxoacyl-[acyl-carrier-protein] synthase-1
LTSRPLGISALGIASPIGVGKAAVAAALLRGARGLTLCNDLIPDRGIYVGGVDAELPPVPLGLERFDCRNNRMMALALREIDREVGAAMARFGPDRIAVILGTSTSGIAEGEAAYAEKVKTGRWPAGFAYSQQEPGNIAEFTARALAIRGPAYTIATACSSTGKVFSAARRLIDLGLCDAAIVGGADTLSRMTVNGFHQLDAVSERYCNPFSLNRDGINVGEAGVAFLLSREGSPVELLGVGESSDAHHMSAPEPSGRGAEQAMARALFDAQLTPADIGYVNLHGTGTVLNDLMEGQAIERLFGLDTWCSSTKGMTGHTLGAAGALEAAFLWLTLHPAYNRGRLPVHVWDGIPDPAIPALKLVTRVEPESAWHHGPLMSNSFAFGGNNVALVMRAA